MNNLSKNAISTNFNRHKILIQMLINKISEISKKIELLENNNNNNNDKNINEDIISIFANYENKIDLLETRIKTLENLLSNQNNIEYSLDNSVNY